MQESDSLHLEVQEKHEVQSEKERRWTVFVILPSLVAPTNIIHSSTQISQDPIVAPQAPFNRGVAEMYIQRQKEGRQPFTLRRLLGLTKYACSAASASGQSRFMDHFPEQAIGDELSYSSPFWKAYTKQSSIEDKDMFETWG